MSKRLTLDSSKIGRNTYESYAWAVKKAKKVRGAKVKRSSWDGKWKVWTPIGYTKRKRS